MKSIWSDSRQNTDKTGAKTTFFSNEYRLSEWKKKTAATLLNAVNQSKAAKYMGMSPSNFRHYAAGSKRMSQKQFIKVKEGFE